MTILQEFKMYTPIVLSARILAVFSPHICRRLDMDLILSQDTASTTGITLVNRLTQTYPR